MNNIMNKVFAISLLVLSQTLLAQTPPPRDHYAATFDRHRNRLLIFGGNGNEGGSYLSDLWEYDGNNWVKVSDGQMRARSSHAMIFFPGMNKSLLLGGISKEGEYLSAMGLWDGEKWQQLDGGPSPRYSPAVAYDESREVLVVFSGAGRGEDILWEWQNGKWSPVPLEGMYPTPRVRAQMAYDYIRRTVILFGGYAEGKSAGDMWEWNGKQWKKLLVDTPPARNNHLMISDRGRQRIVLFGGKNRQDDVLFGDTWEWDGSQWTKIADEGPTPRDMTSGAFDENRQRVVLFGGRNKDRQKLGDFWEWDGTQWLPIK